MSGVSALTPCLLETHPSKLASLLQVQVGCHELLGHGSNKLFHRAKDGTLDFPHGSLLNPVTGEPVSSWYEPGQSWDSVFGALSSTYEECRAECVGIYLAANEKVR